MAQILDSRLQALTMSEVARRLRVKVATVQGLIEKGELRARKVGRAWRVPLPALESYLTSPAGNDYDEEPLSVKDLSAIRRGLDDIKAGRTISRTELNRKLGL